MTPTLPDHPLVTAAVRAEEQRCTAMVAGDVDTLDRLLGDDLLYGHTSGTWDTKDAYLGKFRAGQLRYPSMSSEPVHARVVGDTVLLWSEAVGHVVTPVVDKAMHNRLLCVWQRRGDDAVLVALQTTVLPVR